MDNVVDVIARLDMSGTFHTGSASSDPVVEIWDISMHWKVPEASISQDECDIVAEECATWFQHADSKISSNAFLDLVKWNEINPATGRQVTDPTLSTPQSNVNGNASSDQPITSSYRISYDNATRNPRTKGGFYVPRPSIVVQDDGRYSSANVGSIVTNTKAFFDVLAIVTGGVLGVYSRADRAFHQSTRFRVGDVPDNIRRRKNRMHETYQGDTL